MKFLDELIKKDDFNQFDFIIKKEFFDLLE